MYWGNISKNRWRSKTNFNNKKLRVDMYKVDT